jgi:dipeptidyl aminopeptidase/acylaminoacyl peptidase
MRKYRPNCGDAVTKLLGGAPEQYEQRYQQTSPIELLPIRVPQQLIHGDRDQIVPFKQSQDYVTAASERGDQVRLVTVPGKGHFDLISPQSSSWPIVTDAVKRLLESH